jgi:Nitrile hydratase beta subunit
VSAFYEGQPVRIVDLPTFGHNRVPLYVRGLRGIVERVIRPFLIPEDDAFGRRDGRRRTLYRVRVNAGDVWPEYRGGAADEVQLEIYENWLEAIEEEKAG